MYTDVDNLILTIIILTILTTLILTMTFQFGFSGSVMSDSL